MKRSSAQVFGLAALVLGGCLFPLQAASLEAYLAPQEGGYLHVRLLGGDRSSVRYEEVSAPGSPRTAALSALKNISIMEPPAFAEAMELYGSRRYKEAREKLVAIRKAYQEFSFLPDNPAALAGFQILECLRQEGNLEELGKAASGFDKSKLSREYQQRQCDLYAMWEAARTQSWERLEEICKERLAQRLPGSQRSQAAYCLGLAHEAKGRTSDALGCYHEAMAAAMGTADTTTRQAAIHAMRLYRHSPPVAEALKNKKAEAVTSPPPELRELLALARAYGTHFAAGEPLPDDLRSLMPSAGK